MSLAVNRSIRAGIGDGRHRAQPPAIWLSQLFAVSAVILLASAVSALSEPVKGLPESGKITQKADVAPDLAPDTKAPSIADASALAAADRFARAIAAFDKGDLTSAQRLFEEVIALDPSGAKATEARHHLGQLYSQSRSPGVAPLVPSGPATAPATPQVPVFAPVEQLPPSNRARVSGRYRNADEEFIGEIGDRVFFGAGSADLGTRAIAIVEAQAEWLNQKTALNASIAGHADEPNLSPEQNEALSEARAIAVRDRLVAEGVSKERLSIVPWGRDGRLSVCDDVQCQVQNRRAVTVLVPKNSAAPIRPAKPVLAKRPTATQ